MRFVIFLVCQLAIIFAFAPGHLVRAQESPAVDSTNWRVERDALDREFANRLQKVANWSRDQGIEQQVAETFKIYMPRDLGRQYIFLPTEKSMPAPPAGLLGEWLTKINEIKVWQAGRIFELAKRATTAGAGNAAFQLLNEVLYFDKDHAEVRKILGHQKIDDGWGVAPDRIKIRPASKEHDLMKWPAKSYLLATTQNFEIESNHNEEQTLYLAEKLERWHDVWRQVFFEYWSSSDTLQRWIDGKSSYRHSKKRFRVVFFKDRNDYLTHLSQLVRGVEISTGYYSSEQRVSFFYDSDDRQVEDTWRHELTHQLFRESINSERAPFEDQFIWLDEGIATYFESLTDFGDYVTLGGFEARRMQYARIRFLLEGFHVPMRELSAIGRDQLQSRPDMVRIYSEASGLTDMLMNDHNGAMEAPLTDFFKLIYTGRKIKDGSFEELIGHSCEDLDNRYKEYLQVNSDLVAQHLSMPLSRTEMSLVGAGLQDPAYDRLGQCQNLIWIDLSRNSITGNQLKRLANCQSLSQAIFTECGLEPGSLISLTAFKSLDELDLSGSSISDQQLSELSGLSNLTSLRLISTRITDSGLAALEGLPKLRSLDVSRSKVTDAGIARLKQKLPDLKVIH